MELDLSMAESLDWRETGCAKKGGKDQLGGIGDIDSTGLGC